jgi:hypothetical protein
MRNRFVEVHATTQTVRMAAFRFRRVFLSVMPNIRVQIRHSATVYVRIASHTAATRPQIWGLIVLSRISIGFVLYRHINLGPGLAYL